jgi:hypothetical protein
LNPLAERTCFSQVASVQPLSELHRLYWAIRSDRPRLATILMARAKDPVAAGLFASYMYKRGASAMEERYNPAHMARMSEQYVCEILHVLAGDHHSSTDGLTTDDAVLDGRSLVFEQFKFYSRNDENKRGFLTFLDPQLRLENSLVRSALELMKIDGDHDVTNIDLAFAAEAKQILSQDDASMYLQGIWTRPSNNGDFCDAIFRTSPRRKWQLHLVGTLAFLLLYTVFILKMPPRKFDASTGEPNDLNAVEVVFWFCTLCYSCNEAKSAKEDFDSWEAFLQGSGNKLDMICVTIFALSFCFRVISAVVTDTSGRLMDIFFLLLWWVHVHIESHCT